MSSKDKPVRILALPDNREKLKVINANEEELIAHENWLKLLDEHSQGKCLWRSIV